MPWSFNGAILFNKHSEVQMFIWVSGPAETRFSPLAYPGAALSLLDTKDHGRVAGQEKNGDGEKGSGFSCSGSYTRDGSGNQRVSCLQMKQEQPHPRHTPTSLPQGPLETARTLEEVQGSFSGRIMCWCCPAFPGSRWADICPALPSPQYLNPSWESTRSRTLLLWGKERLGWIERVALQYIHCHV